MILKWNFQSFKESTPGEKFRRECVDIEPRVLFLSQNPGEFSLKEMDKIKSELHAFGNKCFGEWFEENKLKIYMTFFIPILAFLFFSVSILNIKYSKDFKFFGMIKRAIKNPAYSIISIAYLLLLILNLIMCKSGMLLISEMP